MTFQGEAEESRDEQRVEKWLLARREASKASCEVETKPERTGIARSGC